MKKYTLKTIGYIRKIEDRHLLEILPEYKEGLFRLEMVSHIFVLWWIHKLDRPEVRKTYITVPRVRNAQTEPETMGTFATRSPRRPNPIGLTLVKITKISENKIFVDEIDAYDGTPVIDIKPYLPNGDRVESEIRLPPWFQHLLKSRPSERKTDKN
ncbi:MAG: tRNA (N6-threonylcarbamoyladenosine(37)-N6)-methyltransferase TrmO [Candidatus Hodarchaeales archaeon]